MTLISTQYNRRSFLKVSAAAGGGMMIGFSWLTRCTPVDSVAKQLPIPNEWFDFNGYLKIGDTGLVTIFSPNPEIGQNVKTSMPMVVAEFLEVDWKDVVVEQAPLNTGIYQNQFAGGSMSIKLSWDALRMAGATAKQMLINAAAEVLETKPERLYVEKGLIKEKEGERQLTFGEVAQKAAALEVPEEVDLKEPKEYKILGGYTKNVEGPNIVTGKPLYGLDYEVEGMKLAMIQHAPAFGIKLKDFNVDEIKGMPGITDAFTIDISTINERWSDTNAFPELIVIVGDSTWQLMKAKKAIKANWVKVDKLEDSSYHEEVMKAALEKDDLSIGRKDGNTDEAFENAKTIIERSYSSPFLPHNTMEPMNFFADVKSDKAELVGPTQTPVDLEKSVAKLLDLPVEKIEVKMTRMGGGFGRRLYVHFGVEAAAISKHIGGPVKLIYTREDDMTQGTYRPAYFSKYKAGLDENNELIAFEVLGTGLPESAVFPNRFPAGTIDHYSAKRASIKTNISIGAWRAPMSHFTANAEQAFLDEVAEAMGKDPIEFRLDLFKRAKENPVGTDLDYEADRYAGVLELVKEKSGWGNDNGMYRGVAAYFCHNSYVAQVMDLAIEDEKMVIKKVWCAVDCGIVINSEGAENQIEGSIVDAIGHSLYSNFTFEEGAPQQSNFNNYQLIRNNQAPLEIEVFFVENEIAPTGLGEPAMPPAVAALTNALYKATGERFYHQPFKYSKKDELMSLS